MVMHPMFFQKVYYIVSTSMIGICRTMNLISHILQRSYIGHQKTSNKTSQRCNN